MTLYHHCFRPFKSITQPEQALLNADTGSLPMYYEIFRRIWADYIFTLLDGRMTYLQPDIEVLTLRTMAARVFIFYSA
jgi:hypothetical protein